MRLTFISILVAASICRGEPSAAGRWEGAIKIPDREQRAIVDLALTQSGAWTGSITLPGLGVKGAALTDIVIKDSDLSFAIKSALGVERGGPITFKAHLTSDEMLSGDFSEGGNVAPFVLNKAGAAEVEVLPRSTAIAKEIEGQWKGEYEMFGYARHVTITIANHPDGATAEFVVIGKKTNNLPVDLITQESDLLTIDSHATGISFEGRWQKQSDEIKGTLVQGPVELALVLRRAK